MNPEKILKKSRKEFGYTIEKMLMSIDLIKKKKNTSSFTVFIPKHANIQITRFIIFLFPILLALNLLFYNVLIKFICNRLFHIRNYYTF